VNCLEKYDLEDIASEVWRMHQAKQASFSSDNGCEKESEHAADEMENNLKAFQQRYFQNSHPKRNQGITLMNKG